MENINFQYDEHEDEKEQDFVVFQRKDLKTQLVKQKHVFKKPKSKQPLPPEDPLNMIDEFGLDEQLQEEFMGKIKKYVCTILPVVS